MKKRSLIISLTVGGAFLMENLDSTAITTAIPQMAKDFSVDTVTMSTGITAYVIMLAVFIPVSGWVADRYGTRTVFSSAVAGFLLSSIACGLSTTLPAFIVARVFQGISGAMMVPVGRLAVLNNTDKKDLITAIAYITWPGLAGPISGPFLGGLFTTYLSWHWIFFINVPLGVLIIYLTTRHIPNKVSETKRPLDKKGFLLSGIGLSCFMIGIELTGEKNANYLVTGSIVLLALVFLTFAIRHAKRTAHPLIDLSILKIKTFRVTIFTGTLTKIVINTSPLIIPLLFQIGFGMTAFQSGLLFMASMIGNLCMKPATIWVTRKFNFRAVLIGNGFLLATAIFLQAFLNPEIPIWLIVALLFFSGMTRSMQFSSLSALAYSDIPQSDMSNANTMYSTLQQISIAMGITFAAMSLHFAAIFNGNKTYKLEDFQLALFTIAAVCVLSLIQYSKINKTDALNVRGIENK